MKDMRLAFAALFTFIFVLGANAQKVDTQTSEESGFVFKDVKVLPCTSIKNQSSSGTCWDFSTVSFLESEMLRLGKPETDLSEMFVVWHAYSDKAIQDVRMHGSISFSGGGEFHDVINVIKKYGIVPESVYNGLNYGEPTHVHGEMDDVLKSYVGAVIDNRNKKLTTAWHNGFDATLDSYLGEIPNTFIYEGKEYTPQSFARDYVGLDLDDYVEISSFTHHPFYTKFVLEVPDNWAWGEVYNVPLDEMLQIIDNSLDEGYTVAWAADISEKGFSAGRLGVAVVNDSVLSANRDDKEGLKVPMAHFKETPVTQVMRQAAFDDYRTTDDHGMQIIGTATDQDGNPFYKIKNSWGTDNKYNGFFYASKSYVAYKTTSIMVNKHAIPKKIREKLGL